jgi:hypothetical protein
MLAEQRIRNPELRVRIASLRGDTQLPPAASVVIPVNAQADLENVLDVLAELGRYSGPHQFEVVLVVNNYPEGEPPPAVETYRNMGVRTVAVPSVWRAGEAVCFTARIPGIRAAAADTIVLFDADTRIPWPTELLDWYVDQFRDGAKAAYTHVGFYDLRPLWSVRARIAAHHGARWVKRALLRIPTTRGSNYAVSRSGLLPLYDQGLLTDDLNVGPAIKSAGGRVAYSGSKRLVVLTSGRKFHGGWVKLGRYLRYRLLYNVRALRLRTDRPREERNPHNKRPLRP